MRLRATLVVDYEIPDDQIEDAYGSTDPAEVAALDKEAFEDDPGALVEQAASRTDLRVSVEVVR